MQQLLLNRDWEKHAFGHVFHPVHGQTMVPRGGWMLEAPGESVVCGTECIHSTTGERLSRTTLHTLTPWGVGHGTANYAAWSCTCSAGVT